nr:DUF234 domain-containing protein [uncultured Bacteroides sp.]
MRRDYPTYSGLILERYFLEKMKKSKLFTDIGVYWDREGLNETDIIAIDELSHKAVIAEVKRKKLYQVLSIFITKIDLIYSEYLFFVQISIQNIINSRTYDFI